MPQDFHAKKQDIIKRLAEPNESYTDASPKGSVDEGIRELVQQINATDGLVTTSSCSGRIAVYVEGSNTITDASHVERTSVEQTGNRATENSTAKLAGGKGGGRWLFTSHSTVDIDDSIRPGAIFERFGLSSTTQPSFSRPDERPQYVHFKFEPMILHILAEDLPKAQKVLNAAMSAGFRESGISSIFDSKGRPQTPLVAVRSSGLAIDSIIALVASGDLSSEARPMVSEEYLCTLVRVGNERFEINTQRMQRFRDALSRLFGDGDILSLSARAGREAFEPIDVRRERMRREGLRRRELNQGISADGEAGRNASNGHKVEISDDYGFTTLLGDDQYASEQ